MKKYKNNKQRFLNKIRVVQNNKQRQQRNNVSPRIVINHQSKHNRKMHKSKINKQSHIPRIKIIPPLLINKILSQIREAEEYPFN